MPRSSFGGRHELGQNFLTHRPTIERIVSLVSTTDGTILEIGAGDGALTRPLAALGRPLTAIDLDERRVARLRRALPHVDVRHADALRHPLDADAVVGNLPFHLTTPLMRRLLASGRWRHAVVLTQWEVARKRAGVGGGTMLTAQSAPWFGFSLHERVPSHRFVPRPGVDGGILAIERRPDPLVPPHDRAAYQAFVRAVFTSRGRSLRAVLHAATGRSREACGRALAAHGVPPTALPRDLRPAQWAGIWHALGARGGSSRPAAGRR